MKKSLILAAAWLVAAFTQAQPLLSEQLRLRATLSPSQDLGIAGSTMYNPRFFDGKIYANQINLGSACFGRYPIGSTLAEMLVNNSSDNTLEHRMVAPFRGANKTNYILGSSSAAGPATKFTRYNYDGTSPLSIDTPDLQLADSFDWVDDNTIIYADYTSGNRKRLYLATVVAEPFSVTVKPTWNANGYIDTSVSTRIRNIRVGEVYSGYAYYGDAGQNTNPNFYAVNLTTGAETLLGNLDTLTGSGSFGLWTVVERGGYLYVQTTDNGIFVYSMTSATTIGPIYTTYTKPQLDAVTGGSAQYFGLDLTSGGKKLLLGGLAGQVFELGAAGVPLLADELQLCAKLSPAADLGISGSSMYNPRLADDKVYANQINVQCFGRYPLGSTNAEVLVNNSLDGTLLHRMVTSFRGANRFTYMLGSGAADVSPTFTRWNFDGTSPNQWYNNVPALGIDVSPESFDWVDNNTVIYAAYTSGNRDKVFLATVVAEPFSVTPSTTWNADGYVTIAGMTRLRNVRVGDVYRGYAYFGDNEVTSANFYAINLASGAVTLLGSQNVTGTGSWGLWTVVERDGYLYVHTSEDGIFVYRMTDATTLGPLYTTYSKAQLDAITGATLPYYGFDITVDARKFVLGGVGEVYVLQGRPSLGISRTGSSLALSWSASAGEQVLQSSGSLSPGGFSDLSPQPTIVPEGELNTASIPVGSTTTFFRLRK